MRERRPSPFESERARKIKKAAKLGGGAAAVLGAAIGGKAMVDAGLEAVGEPWDAGVEERLDHIPTPEPPAFMQEGPGGLVVVKVPKPEMRANREETAGTAVETADPEPPPRPELTVVRTDPGTVDIQIRRKDSLGHHHVPEEEAEQVQTLLEYAIAHFGDDFYYHRGVVQHTWNTEYTLSSNTHVREIDGEKKEFRVRIVQVVDEGGEGYLVYEQTGLDASGKIKSEWIDGHDVSKVLDEIDSLLAKYERVK